MEGLLNEDVVDTELDIGDVVGVPEVGTSVSYTLLCGRRERCSLNVEVNQEVFHATLYKCLALYKTMAMCQGKMSD